MSRKIVISIIYLLSALVLCAQNNPPEDNFFGRVKVIPDVVFGHKLGMALTMDVYQPPKQNGCAVLFINSGGFFSAFAPQQYKIDTLKTKSNAIFITKGEYITPDFMQQFSFQDLLQAGYTVFDIRHSSSPKFMLNEIVADCEMALNYIIKNNNNFKIDRNRIGVWGASAGAYLAAYLGFNQNNKIEAVILYFPSGYDLLKFPEVVKALPALGIKDDILKKLSLYNFISENDPPTLLLYGKQDSNFIIDPSEKLFQALDSVGVETKLIKYPAVGHMWREEDGQFNREISSKAMSELIAWFNKHLIKN
jgi:acetyl esterase/lipase